MRLSKKHQGIILLKIHPPRFPKLQAALLNLSKNSPTEGFIQRLIILKETGYHVIS